MNSFQPALYASARPEAVAMLLEIEEESAKAPKRGNIIRNKIDAAHISHAGPFGKLMRSIGSIPFIATGCRRGCNPTAAALSATDAISISRPGRQFAVKARRMWTKAHRSKDR